MIDTNDQELKIFNRWIDTISGQLDSIDINCIDPLLIIYLRYIYINIRILTGIGIQVYVQVYL
jgi:hypothetical protein